MPPGRRPRRRDGGERDADEDRQQRAARRSGARAAASGWLSIRKPTASPAASSTAAISTSSAPRSCPGIRARGQRDPLGRQRVAREGPARPRAPTRRAATSSGSAAAQAQRHGGEPVGEADQQREQRAARIGQHQAREQQPERGPRQRVGRPGCPSAAPPATAAAARRAPPSARPRSSSRTARAGARRSRPPPARPGTPSSSAPRRRRARSRARRRAAPRPSAAGPIAPARARPPARRGRRTCGWPRARSRAGDSDQMIESAVNTASAAKPSSITPPYRRPSTPRETSAAATSAGAEQDQPDLGPGRALEPEAAVGGEGDGGEHAADGEREPGVRAHARERQGRGPRPRG